MKNELTIERPGFPTDLRRSAKRFALSTLVATYSSRRHLGRVCRQALARANRLLSYVRGIHLLVLERIADPPVETVRLISLAAGDATFKMALTTPGLIEDHIIRDRSWEPQLTELMSILMSPKGVFIDVGANIGWHSLYLAARYPGAQCLAFEPHPEIFRQLARNTRLSSLKNLTVNQFALGRTGGQGVFYMQDAGSYNRGLSSAAPNADLKDAYREAVIRFEPLDDVLSEADRHAVTLIKIDTQGCEQDVLAGAQQTIADARPTVILEFESRYHPDPEREIRAIVSLLPDYEIFCQKVGSTDLRRFNIGQVKDSRFEADLVCIPL